MSISDIFKSILKFFLNPKIPLSNKAIVFIISIFLLLVIDNIIGFSYYYNNQKQFFEALPQKQNFKREEAVAIGKKLSLFERAMGDFLKNYVMFFGETKDRVL